MLVRDFWIPGPPFKLLFELIYYLFRNIVKLYCREINLDGIIVVYTSGWEGVNWTPIIFPRPELLSCSTEIFAVIMPL